MIAHRTEVSLDMSFGKCLFSVLLAAAFAVTAFTQETAVQQAYEPDQCEIAVGSYLFFRIRTPAAGFKVSERQRLIESRLVEIMSNHAPEPVTIGLINGKPTIYVDGVKLVTVYPHDLKANKGTSLMKLAQTWAERVRIGLKTVWPGCQYSAKDATTAAGEPTAITPVPVVAVPSKGK
ncbi:MAG: hypothetical protein ACUVX8_15240 [Candidatus Zipacnadales bacterium]